ncbi:hypothetical protein HMPREF1326_00563 [Akkermansia sp. KLE1605]|nr:hypothetical protein HMPREF1326_00563 [Akkermansia sp. KLE1605]
MCKILEKGTKHSSGNASPALLPFPFSTRFICQEHLEVEPLCAFSCSSPTGNVARPPQG